MKTLALFSILIMLLTAGTLSAQDSDHGDKKNNSGQPEIQQVKTADASILDKLQKETEDISVVKPFMILASLIEERLDLRRSEREFIAANRAHETGTK